LLIAAGGHLCNESEKIRLQNLMWPDLSVHIPSAAVIAKSAQEIARMADIQVAESCSFLMVTENEAGETHPFSGEKLSSVLTLYRYTGGIDNAIRRVNTITAYQGQGHTCGIHSKNDNNIMAVALATKTGRVMVNQNLNEGAGSLRNGLPYTLSLSCGTWGDNITTENINARHLINLTWVSRPITPRILDENSLFAEHWQKYNR
jgi:sulfoacetaldehyde dehydrogenase